MFFILSRLFAWIASPLAYIFILFVLAAFLPIKYGKEKTVCSIVAVAMVFFFSNPWLYTQAERLWLRGISVDDGTAHYAYGVVLGGYAEYDDARQTIEYKESIDRLISAVRLYRDERVERLVISGDGSVKADSAVFCREMQKVYSIPPEDIIIDKQARNTRENASGPLALLGDSLLQSPVAVFTSVIHARRAMLCFDRVGVHAVYVPSDYNSRNNEFVDMWCPDFKMFDKWSSLLHEWIGWVVYCVC